MSLLLAVSNILADAADTAGTTGGTSNVPAPVSNAPEALTDKVNTVLGIAAWAGTAAGVAGVLITGAMMAVSVKRGESSEHMSRLGMVLGGCVLVATAGPLISFVFA
ncbi:hypothetical protein ACIQM0_26990 [Streptomyces sp. NPDC091387]|uniref:hypothetical protein n=1 Tax=Streptomyces sp. NPDC091387 TaxID=3365998 RepID=UPI003809E22F